MTCAQNGNTPSPWKHFFSLPKFDLACVIFAFLSVGKTWQNVFFALTLLSAFGCILLPVREASHRNALLLMAYPIALAHAARVGILIIYAGLEAGVKFHGALAQPAEWESLTFNLAGVLIQFSGLAGLVVGGEWAWRNRRQFKIPMDEFVQDMITLVPAIALTVICLKIVGYLVQIFYFRMPLSF